MEVVIGRVDMVGLDNAEKCRIGETRRKNGRVVLNGAVHCREGKINLEYICFKLNSISYHSFVSYFSIK